MPSTWVDLHAMSNLAIGLGRKVLVKNEGQSIASVYTNPIRVHHSWSVSNGM